MPDGTHDQRRRDTLMRLPIGEVVAWHLVVTCGTCQQSRIVRLEGLVARFGSEKTLLALVPKLRCKVPTCGRPPTGVRLRNKMPAHPGPSLVDVVVHGRG